MKYVQKSDKSQKWLQRSIRSCEEKFINTTDWVRLPCSLGAPLPMFYLPVLPCFGPSWPQIFKLRHLIPLNTDFVCDCEKEQSLTCPCSGSGNKSGENTPSKDDLC